MWLLITVLANLFNGAVYLADKYFLSKKVPSQVNNAIVIAICIPIPENFKY